MTVSTKSKHIGIIKVDLMSAQLYWIVLDCTGVTKKVATEYIKPFWKTHK